MIHNNSLYTVQITRYKIQETLFNVDFQEYNLITLAMSYFVDKHDMKNCTSIHILTKITD